SNFAGPFMNILLGFVVFLIWTFTVPDPATTTVGSTQANSPARDAKIVTGDQIVAINGQKINNFDQVSQQINQSKGKALHFELKKNGKIRKVKVKTKDQKIQQQKIYKLKQQKK